MANITQVNFSFAFASLPQLETHVVRFSGTAALNSLYDLAITLLLPTEAFEKTDIETLMSSRCSLTIDDSQDRLIEHWPSAWKTSWHGLLTKLEVGSQAGQYTFLEVCLGPTIGLLSGQLQNRIHLDLSSLDVLKDSFRFGGLSADQFSIKAQKDAYPKREFVFQYEEDLLDFVWRTLWREGLCLFYDQNGQSDLALVTDAPEQHPCCYDGSSEIGFSYSSLTGLKGDGPQIFSMRSENRLPPNSILLKDYNWEDPNRPLAVKVRVSPKGRGEVHLYGQNFTTLAEGQRLGNIRRDEYLSNSETFRAVTRAPGLMPGLTFAINSHPIASNNDRFLVTSSEIIGSQADRLTAVLGLDLGTEKSDFTNNLKFRRLDKPFRPSLTLPRSKISGSLTAWIDGSGGGATPELDQWGRYKVLFPLDVSGRSQGKASAWLRMAQPYVGKGYGQNFPLTPGAEVLITFIDGNPDRPVISGAVPNAENISLINSATNTYSGLGTKGGSALLFGDEAGKQKISLTSGSNRAGLTINAESPTTATVVADYMNLLNASMLTLVGTSSKTLTGSDYTVSASGNSLLKFLSLLQTAKTTVKTGVDQYKNYASLEDSDPNSKRAQIADIVAKGAGCLDSLGNIVFKSVSAGMSVAAAKKDLLLKPHNNLVSLTASAAASNASWRSKESPSASLPVLLGLFGNFLSAAADVSDGVVDSKDLAKGKDEQGQGGADPDLSFSRKILSASQAMGSKLADIITQFTSFFLTLAALIKASGKPKGIVINNSDSYVNIKARNYASLSGHGPVIIESTKTSLADLLRLGTFDLTRPHSPIKAESYASNPDFEDTNAVLTMTELARTIADEISLQSTRAVIAKSQNQIQLIAGLNPPETAAKNVYENARSAANTAYNAWNTSVPNLKSNKALALHNSTKSLLDIPMPPAYDSTHSKGILIMTKDKSMPITLQTSVPTSNIELLRGVANRPGTEADNKLLMSQAKTVLQADNNALLALTPTSSKAVLQADSTTNLTLEPNSAKLVAGNASSSLIMNASGTTLSGSTQLELKLGSNTFTMTDTNIKVTGPSLNLEGQSITKLGS